jgi:transposase
MSLKSPTRYVGIDVSMKTLDVACTTGESFEAAFQVANNVEGFTEVLARITAGGEETAQVVVEATGAYSVGLVDHLTTSAQIRLMVVQPKAARDFARASMRRAKTDRVDAKVLAEFSQRMPFVPTVRIDKERLVLRQLARHLGELVDRRTQILNQQHALAHAGGSPVLERFLEAERTHLEGLIATLEAEIIAQMQAMATVAPILERTTRLAGFKKRSAARILPELLAMPPQLTARQCVAFVGLDPCPKQSGIARAGTSWPISRKGNARIRRSLYMVALSAVRWFPPLRAFYEALRARGKPKKVALTACMRKFLTALWAMVARGEDFDEKKFCRVTSIA